MARMSRLPASATEALPGRSEAMEISGRHFVSGRSLVPPFEDADGPLPRALFGMGCFWGAERRFWEAPGAVVTAVGYAGGFTRNPKYEEVCSGLTGHNEVVLVVVDRASDFRALLGTFWASHDPTQGMRQGNDLGTQYRSGIYVYSEEHERLAHESREQYQRALSDAGRGRITTEIVRGAEFYYAEEYHQQYLAKNPRGYCGLGGTGVAFPGSCSA